MKKIYEFRTDDSNGKDLYGKPWHFDIEHEEDFMKEVSAIPYDKEVVREYLAFLDNLDFENWLNYYNKYYSIEFCPICTYFWISLDVSLFFSLLHPICACFWILFGCFSDFLADYIQSALTSGFFLDVFLTFLLSASNPLLFLVFLWMFLLHSY